MAIIAARACTRFCLHADLLDLIHCLRAALRALDAQLADVAAGASAEDLQTMVYEIGKDEAYGFDNLRDWFRALYETLLGSEQGPRMGSFIKLYGVEPTRKLIAEALAR